MQGRHPEGDIILNDKERKALEKISKSRTTEARLVQRAKIILLASKRKYRNTEIGLKVGCNRDTVRLWKKRFHKHRLNGFKDNQRSGHPPKFTAKERTRILAMATKSPESEKKHFTDWSARELAKHLVEKKIVRSIHWTTVSNWLRKADIKPHKWEYWLNSKDPDFEKKNVRVH